MTKYATMMVFALQEIAHVLMATTERLVNLHHTKKNLPLQQLQQPHQLLQLQELLTALLIQSLITAQTVLS